MTERRGRLEGPNGSYWSFPIPAGEKAELSVGELFAIAREPALRAMRRGRGADANPPAQADSRQCDRPDEAGGARHRGLRGQPRDGTFKLITGKPVQMNAEDRNEWDTVQ